MVFNGRTRVLFSGCKVMEGLTLIEVFLEGATLTCSERNSDARKKNPGQDCSKSIHGDDILVHESTEL
jgi:hypothetical protein